MTRPSKTELANFWSPYQFALQLRALEQAEEQDPGQQQLPLDDDEPEEIE